ncbi:MAG: hypothetical protein VX265_02490 [Myxococcota bacterium]|nr:hypothetical protein [Myxococcota bacterium]MEC8423122.1 hypothetical protein [Myxococcota bacterium]
MLAAIALASALAAPRNAPPTLHAPHRATAVCTDAPVQAAHGRLLQPRVTREHHAQHEHAIAAWAVCARLSGVSSYRLPALREPAATRVLTAAMTEPGRRTRIESLELAAAAHPELVALLALEELGVMALLQKVEPSERLSVAAAAIGSWGCPHAREWGVGPDGQQTAWCTDGRDLETMAREGIRQLVALSQPTRSMEGWLADATAPRVAALWAGLEETWFPIEEPRPVEVPRGGIGKPLTPGLGWTLRIGPDLAIWMPRPRFHITRDGVVVPPATLRTSAPADWDGAPIVYAEGSLPVGMLDAAFREQGVGHPRLVGEGPDGLLELRLGWLPSDASPPPDAVLADVIAEDTTLSRRLRASSATGETWLRVPAALPFSSLVRAQGEAAAARSGPIRFIVVD